MHTSPRPGPRECAAFGSLAGIKSPTFCKRSRKTFRILRELMRKTQIYTTLEEREKVEMKKAGTKYIKVAVLSSTSAGASSVLDLANDDDLSVRHSWCSQDSSESTADVERGLSLSTEIGGTRKVLLVDVAGRARAQGVGMNDAASLAKQTRRARPHAVVLVFSLSCRDSFDHARDLVVQLSRQAKVCKLPLLLVGCNFDLDGAETGSLAEDGAPESALSLQQNPFSFRCIFQQEAKQVADLASNGVYVEVSRATTSAWEPVTSWLKLVALRADPEPPISSDDDTLDTTFRSREALIKPSTSPTARYSTASLKRRRPFSAFVACGLGRAHSLADMFSVSSSGAHSPSGSRPSRITSQRSQADGAMKPSAAITWRSAARERLGGSSAVATFTY